MTKLSFGKLMLMAGLLLTGCGGGDQSGQSDSQAAAQGSGSVTSATVTQGAGEEQSVLEAIGAKMAGVRLAARAVVSDDQLTLKQASAFLSRATFGPTMPEITRVSQIGMNAWLDDQYTKRQILHKWWMGNTALRLVPGAVLHENHFFQTFWKYAIVGEDQLRQRVTYALSQIFVISFQDGAVGMYPRGVACYYDMLGTNAFGNFRQLLEGVATSPMMGIYLSHMQNRPESDSTTPDENFARELMQLMTIGLHQLNQDGTVKLVNQQPVPTYTRDDVVGLAKVFTGWSWGGGARTENRFLGMYNYSDPYKDCLPMQNYPTYHSTSEKRVLGSVIPAGGTGESDLAQALDMLFNHPNVGPFIGRQLIQRLVTSNPSPGYVGRVAAAFANNGEGVRGDMQAVIRAILTDPEAASGTQSELGKLREPVLRLANWLRSFNARSTSGLYDIWTLEDPLNGIGQNVMRSPSVFNFYRPNYSPPQTGLAAEGYVAPEMQIAGESSIVGYLNFMEIAIPYGIGQNANIKPDYVAEIGLADDPEALLDRIDLLLTNGNMSESLREQIIASVETLPIPQRVNALTLRNARLRRVHLAIYLTMASPEYLVMK
ncbi:DUF1800 family protein [Massilia dura]|uniref:DUF1800 family protein n=1 Tax=Pseudoduganella dura TaxID=321982 RepID=A0A6I3X5R1_9BURK|nr:DUF1800 domain-containing protein [Pseudoduganella dura]MUI12074.1 DUF1800 family protein [Pseudoduganella dura]